MKINTNISSMSALRSLGNTSKALGRALERLASGKRINSARDDAAGLAIGTGLESQRRGMLQAVRNVNDAGAYTQVADGALANQLDLVQRMREIAIQAANGTLGANDRSYLNTEIQQLMTEFERISAQSNFNGVSVMDGLASSIQVGTKAGDNVSLSLGDLRSESTFKTTDGEIGTGVFSLGTTRTEAGGSGPHEVEAADLNGDGFEDLICSNYISGAICVRFGNGDGTFRNGSTITGVGNPTCVVAFDFDGDSDLDLAIGGYGGGGGTFIKKNDGNGVFTSAATISPSLINATTSIQAKDYNKDGIMDLSVATGAGNINILLGIGNGTFSQSATITPSAAAYGGHAVGDFNGDGNLDIAVDNIFTSRIETWLGNGDGSFAVGTTITGVATSSIWAADVNNDGRDDLVNLSTAGMRTYLSSGWNSFTLASTLAYTGTGAAGPTLAFTDYDGDGNQDVLINTANATLIVAHGNGNGTFSSASTITQSISGTSRGIAAADFDEDGVVDFATANYDDNSYSLYIGATTTKILNRSNLSVSTQAAASQTLTLLDGVRTNLLTARAQIGAIQNRLESAANVSAVSVENLSAARSQIMDSDVAAETAELTRNQILQQAGVSVLGQANVQMQTVLTLLNGLR